MYETCQVPTHATCRCSHQRCTTVHTRDMSLRHKRCVNVSLLTQETCNCAYTRESKGRVTAQIRGEPMCHYETYHCPHMRRCYCPLKGRVTAHSRDVSLLTQGTCHCSHMRPASLHIQDTSPQLPTSDESLLTHGTTYHSSHRVMCQCSHTPATSFFLYSTPSHTRLCGLRGANCDKQLTRHGEWITPPLTSSLVT